MRRIITVVALMCAVTFQVNSQTTKEERLLKEIEQKVKLADKHPKDGKMQLNAARAILDDSVSEVRDFDRALTYANRALKIAQERPAPKDTLLGLTFETIGILYMMKQEMEKSMEFYEKALDAYEVELGRLDPVTNGLKLAYGSMMAPMQPSRGFPKVLEAMFDNDRAPQDKRIQNMEEANISLEFALEMLMSEQAQRFRYALPTIFIDGKKNFLVQTGSWNMERPLVGWMAQDMIMSDANDNTEKEDDTILFDEDGKFVVLTEADEDKRQLLFNFYYSKQNRNMLKVNDGDSRVLFLNPEFYNNILEKFREFKAANK